MYDHIPVQLQDIREKISAAALKSGRKPEDVKLIAVSKTFPADAIQVAYDNGQRIFGENRVQELESKLDILPADIEWHLIGSLQSNKAARAVAGAAYIHSVDSLKLVNRLDRLAEESCECPKILLEVNISGEASKSGAGDEILAMQMAEAAVAASSLEFVGLMTMAPFGVEETELREVFSGLRKMRDRMEQRLGVKLPELSMGMSSDYLTAIAEGATFVRIGTAIFGGRNYL